MPQETKFVNVDVSVNEVQLYLSVNYELKHFIFAIKIFNIHKCTVKCVTIAVLSKALLFYDMFSGNS